MKEINLVQGSPAWVEYRRDKIGASDAPPIMGVSPWDTPYSLWQEKLELIPARSINAAMQRGIFLEPDARDFFSNSTGIEIAPKIFESTENAFMMASLDGISDDRKTAVEIKCLGEAEHKLAIKGEIPAKYIPQLQHQMAVCELPYIYYLSFYGDTGFLLVLDRDQSYIDAMVEREKAFFECLQTFTPPPLSERDYEARDDEEWHQAARSWADLNARLRDLQKKEIEMREKLTKLADGKNCHGGGVRLAHIARKGAVDYGKIPELTNVNLEIYRKAPSSYTRLAQMID